MIIYPAIDLYQGQAVRLFQGDYDQMTVHDPDPAAAAQRMKAQGATHLHVVDLEGAKAGKPVHTALIARIAKETGLFIQAGGGIRTMEDISGLLAAGARRVILGTKAAEDDAFLQEAARRFGGTLAVGADLRDGKVAVRGWRDTLNLSCSQLADRLTAYGITTMIVTDIARDGAMQGANIGLYKEMQATGLSIIASGGVSSLEDVRSLRALNLAGAIIGKAYYTGAVDLGSAIREAL